MNQSHYRVLRLVVTIAMLLGAGTSIGLALDTIHVSFLINPKEAALSQRLDFSLLQQFFKEGCQSYDKLLLGKSSKLTIIMRCV